jgi:hypothetical protein
MTTPKSIITQLKARIRELEEENEKLRRIIVELRTASTSKAGKARAAKLSPERRREIASQAAKARWARRKGGE